MGRLSLAQRFLIWSLVILAAGMAGIGLWVSRQIEDGIVHRTASTTALYVDSLIALPLQGMSPSGDLPGETAAELDRLLRETPLGQRVAVFRVWDPGGRVVYSTVPAMVGQRFPVEGDLADAFRGDVSADVGSIEGEVNLAPGLHRHDLLEIYSPVRSSGTGEVIAVAEFYYGTADIQGEIADARRRSWLVVVGSAIVIYLLLAAFVQRASDTILRQQSALGEQVGRLTELLRQNSELHQRVQGAAARTTALNERFLRRFAAELHDGPAQDISLALLRLDSVAERCAGPDGGASARTETARDLDVIQGSLRHALQDVREASAGLMLPHVGRLTVENVVEHAVRSHRRRTRSEVAVVTRDLPHQAPLAVKIAIYRIVQEALTNAWRHAGGAGQRVDISRLDGSIRVEVVDSGPGFDPSQLAESDEHLGLIGIRERVESLGGEFRIASEPARGTRVIATLPLQPIEATDG